MSKSKAKHNRAMWFAFHGDKHNSATRLYNWQFWQTLDKAQQSAKAGE